MAWIKMRHELLTEIEVVRLAELMEIREEAVVGYLFSVWTWFDKHTTDGVVQGLTIGALERVLHLPEFLRFMVSVGWLEYVEIGNVPIISVPNWSTHNAQSAKERALTTKRKQTQRSRHGNVTVDRDKSVTREEKIREDKSIETTNVVSCSEPSGEGTEPTDWWVFPVKGHPATWSLPVSKLREYQEAYPGIDLAAQLREARQWCRDNPGKRKTARGMTRFLNQWLGSSQKDSPAAQSSSFDAMIDRIAQERATAVKGGDA